MAKLTNYGMKISDNGGDKENAQRNITSVLITRGVTFIFDRDGDNYNLIVFANKSTLFDIVSNADELQDFSSEQIEDMIETINNYGEEVKICQEVGAITITSEYQMVIGNFTENTINP